MKTIKEVAAEIVTKYSNDYYTPGDELDMVNAAVLDALEQDRAQRPSIFLVQYNVERDSYYSGWHWEEVPELDRGFFLTQEEAQAEADRLNNYAEKYASYVRKTEERNRGAEVSYARQQSDHEKAKAAGLAHLAPVPVREPTVPVLDFEGWKAAMRVDCYYDVVEVAPHASM